MNGNQTGALEPPCWSHVFLVKDLNQQATQKHRQWYFNRIQHADYKHIHLYTTSALPYHHSWADPLWFHEAGRFMTPPHSPDTTKRERRVSPWIRCSTIKRSLGEK